MRKLLFIFVDLSYATQASGINISPKYFKPHYTLLIYSSKINKKYKWIYFFHFLVGLLPKAVMLFENGFKHICTVHFVRCCRVEQTNTFSSVEQTDKSQIQQINLFIQELKMKLKYCVKRFLLVFFPIYCFLLLIYCFYSHYIYTSP